MAHTKNTEERALKKLLIFPEFFISGLVWNNLLQSKKLMFRTRVVRNTNLVLMQNVREKAGLALRFVTKLPGAIPPVSGLFVVLR